MCGIAGYQVPEARLAPGPERLGQALMRLRHRGPDGEGTFFTPDGRTGLAHTRLAVIDAEGGAQPMVDPHTGAVLVVNGEIYNFRELFREFEAQGRPTRSRSDTEAALTGFSLLGAGVLSRLRGMFALAAFDPRNGTLLLARDRMGQKPLFHAALAGGGLAFASEIPALLSLLDRSPEPDEEALSVYLSFGYFPAPLTAYRGVRRLPAAHLIRADGSAPKRWWSRPPPAATAPSEADAADMLTERIREAVRLRLVSDVPLGAFLSGGLDSAAVVAFAAEAGGEPLRTFTVRNPVPEYDESGLAREVAARFGTRHEEIELPTPSVEEIPDLLATFDEPFGDSSALVTALVSRAARPHVTVALTGDGGDEVFGGYHRFSILSTIGRVPRIVGRLAGGLVPGRPGRALGLAGQAPWRRYYEFYESFNGGARERLLSPRFLGRFGEAPARFLEALYGSFPGGELDRMLATDATTWLPDDLNLKVDIASMAVALECRSPLQDHLLVEAAAGLPASMHVRGANRKRLLRRILSGRVPDAVLTAAKRGFAAPVEHWFRGDLRGFLAAKLSGEALRSLDIVRPEAVAEVVRSLDTGSRTGRPHIQVWILLALALFAERLAGRSP